MSDFLEKALFNQWHENEVPIDEYNFLSEYAKQVENFCVKCMQKFITYNSVHL